MTGETPSRVQLIAFGRQAEITIAANAADADVSTDATLSALVLSNPSATLSPAFAADTLAYTATVPRTATTISLAGTANASDATLKYLDSADNELGDGSGLELGIGANVFRVEVTAESGATTTYTVTVTRTGVAVASLSDLTLSPGHVMPDVDLVPSFGSSVDSYTAAVPANIDEITIKAETTHTGATVRFLDASDRVLADADTDFRGHQVALTLNAHNPVKVEVTAEDGTTQIYVVTITRGTGPMVLLPSVGISKPSGTFTEGAADLDLAFTLTISPAPTEAVTVNLDVAESGGDMVASGDEGAQTVTIDANQTTATYTVVIAGDRAWEEHSEVTVTVAAGTGYMPSLTRPSARVEVSDDDFPDSVAALSLDPGTVNEGGMLAAIVTVTTGGDQLPHADVPRVTLATQDGTATSADDFTALDATAPTFGAFKREDIDLGGGQDFRYVATGRVTISTTQDTAPENSEDFQVVMAKDTTSPNQDKLTLEGSPATVTIAASDFPNVGIDAPSGDFTEGATDLTFTVTRSETSTEPLTVNLKVSEDGGEMVTRRERGRRKTVTIAADATTATYTVPTSSDVGWEEHSTVTVEVIDGAGYTISMSKPKASKEVKDDDFPTSKAALTVSPAEVDEGEGVTVTLTITTDAQAQPHRGSGEIRLLATSGTATSGTDFSALDELVSFADTAFSTAEVEGNTRYQASVSRTITITDDTLSENVERFVVSQAATTGEQGTAPGLMLATPLTVDVDINSSDYPAVSIATASGTVVEGTAVTFTLSRPMATAGAALDVTVDVSESGDVVAMDGEGEQTVSFDANETTATLTVATVADTAYEDNSVVTAAIQTGDGYTISGGTATRTVNDDDFPVATAVLSVSATDVEENGSLTATLTITTTMDQMPHGPPGTFRIHTSAASSGDPAAPGTDYASTNESVALDFTSVTSTDVTDNNIDDPVYQASESVTISLPDDTEYEGAEHFTVNLSAVTTGAAPAHANVSLEAPTSFDITIAANDLPVVSIAPTSTADVTEGDVVEFTVTRSQATATALDVRVAVTESSTLVPDEATRTVTIPANMADATLTIATSTDDDWDEHGTVTATVLAGTGYTPSATNASAGRDVKDNDLPDISLLMTLSAAMVDEDGTLMVTHTFETDTDHRPHRGTGSITPEIVAGDTDAADGVVLQDVDIKADAGDFTKVNNVWRATVTQTVTVGDDTDREDAETFQIQYPSGSDLDDKVTAGAAVSVTINASDDTADDADLTGLAISPGTLNETFANTLKTYTATVGGLVSQITITPTRSVNTATVAYSRVTGVTETTLSDADSATANTFEVDLAEGDNVIKVVVTTLDELYTNTFTITVTREPLISISVAAAAVTEGGDIVFTVTRAAAATSALDVRVERQRGRRWPATWSHSANERTHTVTIDAGATSAELSIATVDDKSLRGARDGHGRGRSRHRLRAQRHRRIRNQRGARQRLPRQLAHVVDRHRNGDRRRDQDRDVDRAGDHPRRREAA